MIRFSLLAVILLLSSFSRADVFFAVEKNFSKWYIVTNELKLATGSTPHMTDQEAQDWRGFQVHVSTQSSRIIFGKGYTASEFEALVRKGKPSASFLSLFIPTAQAKTDCDLRSQSNAVREWTQKVSAESIVSACEWNPAEVLKGTVEKIIAEAKGILSLDVIQKIDRALDAAKSFVKDFKEKILPALSKLAEHAPGLVNHWACEKIRNEIPMVALSVAVPSLGIRRAPLVLAETLAEVKFLVSDQVVNLVKKMAQAGRLEESALHVVSRLSPHPPEIFNNITVHPPNLEKHAAIHSREYSASGDPAEYYKSLEQFMGGKDSADVYLKTRTTVVKFNPQSGNILVLSPEGRFISFYKVEGDSAEARMEKFVNKQAAYERKTRGDFPK